MRDLLSQFLGFFLFTPLFSIFFGFLFWLGAVLITKGAAARVGVSLLLFMSTGYVIVGLFALYLLIDGDDAGSGTEYGPGPLLGVLASFALLLLVWRRFGGKIKKRWPGGKPSGGPPVPPGAPTHYGAVDPRTGQQIYPGYGPQGPYGVPGPYGPVPPGPYGPYGPPGPPPGGSGPYGGRPQQYGAPPPGSQVPYGQLPNGAPPTQWSTSPDGWSPQLPRPVTRPPASEPRRGDGERPQPDDPESSDSP